MEESGFRILDFSVPFDREGLHNSQPVFLFGSEIKDAEKAVIMLHGRGTSAKDMLDLTKALKNPLTTFIVPQAYNNTWYPLRFMEPRKFNQAALKSSFEVIDNIIRECNSQNIESEKILFFGFSQGACLAFDYAVRNPQKFGGVAGLSGGLIGKRIYPADYSGDMLKTNVLIACGDHDLHIPVKRVKETSNIFSLLNADVTENIYEGMGHNINNEEIALVKEMIRMI